MFDTSVRPEKECLDQSIIRVFFIGFLRCLGVVDLTTNFANLPGPLEGLIAVEVKKAPGSPN